MTKEIIKKENVILHKKCFHQILIITDIASITAVFIIIIIRIIIIIILLCINMQNFDF